MPRYLYKCEECREIFEVMHSMNSVHEECEFCESSEIHKIPARIGLNLLSREKKTGELVKQHIKDSLFDLKKQKSDSKKGKGI